MEAEGQFKGPDALDLEENNGRGTVFAWSDHALPDGERGMRVSDHCLAWRNPDLGGVGPELNRNRVVGENGCDTEIAEDFDGEDPRFEVSVLSAE
jgi:hypothetical protein